MPAQRSDMILNADNPSAAIDKLENRERELERLIERDSIQLAPLKKRLSELRRTELVPRIEFHQSVFRKIEADIDAAVEKLIELNKAADDALQAAVNELGDDGRATIPLIGYGANASDLGLALWRGRVRENWASIARTRERMQ